MDGQIDRKELPPTAVVSAVYYPSKRRLIVSGLTGALFGLIAAMAYALFSGAEGMQLVIAISGPAVGAILALLTSVRSASLRFGSDWVEGPMEGGTGSVLIRRSDVGRLEVVDPHRIRLIRGDMVRLLVDLNQYDFMDAQMIRMRLSAIAGGTSSTPPETLVVDSRRRRRPRIGRRGDKDAPATD